MARKAAKPKAPKTPPPDPAKVQEWWKQEAAKNAKPQTPQKPLNPGAQRAQDLPKFKAAAKQTQETAKVAQEAAKAASGKKIYVTPSGTAQPAPIGSMKPSGANPYGNMGKLARIGTGMALADVAGMIQEATPESMHGEYATDRNPNSSAWTALNKMTGDAAIAAGEVTNAVGEGRFLNDLFTSNEAMNKPPAVQAALAQQDENFQRAMGVNRNQYVANLQPALDPMAAHTSGAALPSVAHPFSAPEDSDYMKSFGRNTDGVQAPFGPRIIERNGKKVLTNLGPSALPNYVDMNTLEAQKGFSPTMEFNSPINIQNGKVTPNPMYGGVPQAPELAVRGLDERLGDVTGGGVPDSMEGFMVANFMQNQLRRDDIFNNKQALDLYKTQMTALPQLMQEDRMRQRLPSDINYQDAQAMYQREV